MQIVLCNSLRLLSRNAFLAAGGLGG
jgi:hypothetical protein